MTGWSRDYAHVASKATFTQTYHRVHHQLRRWARWRHPHKGYRWRMARYWHRHHGTLVFGQTRGLPRHPETPITRHAKIAGRRSPFDGDWTYWGKRLRHYTGLLPSRGNSSQPKRVAVTSVDYTSRARTRPKCIIGMGIERITGSPTSPSSIATVTMRCTVPMTRAIGLRSCMIGNGHVQFCSGRRWSNLPPDRNLIETLWL